MSQRQNDARLMCEYPIYGTVSDVSHMSAGVIYVRPCYFKPGVDKEVALFLRDAKKEHWAIRENLKVGTKLTFKIALDPLKGPKAVELHTIQEAPKEAYDEPWRPECIPNAKGFQKLIEKARKLDKEEYFNSLKASSDPIDRILLAILDN